MACSSLYRESQNDKPVFELTINNRHINILTLLESAEIDYFKTSIGQLGFNLALIWKNPF
jgi:hypothetical protein